MSCKGRIGFFLLVNCCILLNLQAIFLTNFIHKFLRFSMRKTFLSAFMLLFVLVATLNLEAKVTNLDEKIPLSPKVTTGKLDNGLTYFIMENKKPEKRAELHIVFRAGSVQEDDYQRGIAHFVEHMCFNGTKNFPKDALVKFLESTGVRFGADLNASTAFDRTYYTLTIPLDKSGMLEQGMQVLEDWARWVSFDSVEIEKERGVILEEKRLRGGANMRLMEKHFSVLLKGSKYADRMPIGTEEIIKTAPKQAFLNYYNDWYRPDLTAVIVVGDIKTNDMLKMIKKHFDSWKFNGKGKERDKGKYPIPNNKEPLVSVAYDKELQYGQATLYIKHNKLEDYTYRTYRQSLKDQMFGQMLNMRLQELSKEAEPPFMYAGGGSGNLGLGDIRALTLAVVPTAGKFASGFEKSLGELFRADQFGFTAGELKRAKEGMMANIEKYYNERDKTESMPLAQELERYFDEGESAPGIEKEYELYKEWLPEITLEEINQMVADLITDQNVVITVSLPEASTEKPTEQEVLAIYNKAKAAKYTAYVDDLGDKPLLEKKPTPGKVTATKKLPNYDITEMTLSNGARVLLKPTDFKNDEILFSCWGNGGASQYSDLNDFRTAGYAAELIDECGLGEFTSTNLQKMLQGKMVGISPYIGDYTQGMRGSTTPKDMETFFQLLNMQFTQSRQDDKAFQSWSAKAKDILANKGREPQSVFMDTVAAVQNNYDPRKMPSTIKDIDNIKLASAFKIYKERYADAANFTFLFVGAFKIDEIKPYIEQYIASLPAINKKEALKDLGIRVPSGKINKTVKKGIEPKSTVILNVKTDANFAYNSENILKANLLKEVLDMMIREELREEKGGVYSPGVWNRISKVPVPAINFNVWFGCDPARVDELVISSQEVFEKMMTSQPSAEHLKSAKEILKKEFEKNMKENRYWYSVIEQYDYTGRDLAFLKDYEKSIDKVTAKDIQDAAKQYLDYKKNMIRVVLMPEDDE